MQRATTVVTLGVAAVAAAVRLPGVWRLPFWEDEVASARILREPSVGSMLHRVRLTESTPPLWYGLAWALHRLHAPLRDVRLLSVACGVLLAAAVVVLARRSVPLPLAAAAGLMTALGGEFVWHGHELRAYELFALESCLFGLCLVRLVEARGRGRVLALAATVAAGGSTHYFFAFSAFAALGWVWVDPRVRAARRRVSAAVVAGGAVAAVWTPLMLAQYRHHGFSWIGPFRLRVVLATPLRLFTGMWNGTPAGALLSLAVLAVVVAGCIRLARTPSGAAVGVLALAPLAEAALVWLAGSHVFAVRNMIGIGPFVAVAAVAALAALPRPAAAVAGAVAAAALGASLSVSYSSRLPPFETIAHALVRDGWDGRAPIAVFGNPLVYRSPLEWYLPQRPTLAVARLGRLDCGRLFVVHPSGRVTVADGARPGRAELLVEPGSRTRCRPAAGLVRRRPLSARAGRASA